MNSFIKKILYAAVIGSTLVSVSLGAKQTKLDADTQKSGSTSLRSAEQINPQPKNQSSTDQDETPTNDQTTLLTGEQIKWQVMASGGGRGTSTNFILTGTAGQTAVGSGTSTSYKVSKGFWQNFSSSCCVLEGNANHVGGVNVADVTYLVKFLFQSGPPPPCLDEANANDLGGINVSDVTRLIDYLFKGGLPLGSCP